MRHLLASVLALVANCVSTACLVWPDPECTARHCPASTVCLDGRCAPIQELVADGDLHMFIEGAARSRCGTVDRSETHPGTEDAHQCEECYQP